MQVVSIGSNMRILILGCFLVFSSLLSAETNQELSTQKEIYSDYKDYSKMWQWGWTGVFASSIALNSYTIFNDESLPEEKFDAKVGFVTSFSGLLSMIRNPLALAFGDDWDGQSEIGPKAQESKVLKGRSLFSLSLDEIHRRQSLKFQMALLTEQLIAAGFIAFVDDRPKDAVKRFLVGMITSELWVFSLPGVFLPSADLEKRLKVELTVDSIKIAYLF